MHGNARDGEATVGERDDRLTATHLVGVAEPLVPYDISRATQSDDPGPEVIAVGHLMEAHDDQSAVW
jgi:hypothetical protein